MTTTALAILTYADDARPPELFDRLPTAVETLELSGYRGKVFIVDDGSTSGRHLSYLDSLERKRGYTVVRRKTNGGTSRSKNTCLRVLMDSGTDIGLLAEDDVIFSRGWDSAYCDAMMHTGIHHFSWYVSHPENRVVVCNGRLVTRTAGLTGAFATFTREVIRRVGGLKVLPCRYGYGHVHWTQRIIRAGLCPFYADIPDSNRLIRLNDTPSTLSCEEIGECIRENQGPAADFTAAYEPLLE